MFISPLFNKVKGDSTVTLTLKRTGTGITYYMTANTIGYCVVTSGSCVGDMDEDFMSFNISLSTLTPLLDKGFKLRLEYFKKQLTFVSESGSVRITPLYVNSMDTLAHDTLKRFFEFDDIMLGMQSVKFFDSETARIKSEISEIDETIKQIEEVFNKYGYDLNSNEKPTAASVMDLETGVSLEQISKAQDIITSLNTKKEVLLKKLDEVTEQRKKSISAAYGDELSEIDLLPYKRVIEVAAKAHQFVSFCTNFMTVSLKDCHIIQKCECPTKGIAANILNNLLKFVGGQFYLYKNQLLYNLVTDTNVTRVFIDSYLPDTRVDSSLITKGQLQEKYEIDITEIERILMPISSKFNATYFDMNTSMFHLLNDQGEEVRIRFKIKSLDTRELRRTVNSEANTQAGMTVHMSRFYVPMSVARLFYLFRSGMTIYVKDRKIIFQNAKLYIVFGRQEVKEP